MAANQFFIRHQNVKNAAVILLSLFLLPLDTLILVMTLFSKFIIHTSPTKSQQSTPSLRGPRRTILVTGVGMTKGLTLARLFKKAGHRVIGANFESDGGLVPGRVSNSLDAFYSLQKPGSGKEASSRYIKGVLDIVVKENVELWVSCSKVLSATEDSEVMEVLEKRTQCKSIQFDVATIELFHEKHNFIEHTRKLGLTVPETHTITSRAAVEKALKNATHGREYLLKCIGADDIARGEMTSSLLPKDSAKATSQFLDKLNISEKNPWILQQFIRGEEYCTHALVVRGRVMAFVACPSSELLMYYEALPADSALSKAMLRFTERQAEKGGRDFTGHLSFDFLIEDTTPNDPEKLILYPIECNPRAHTAVVLFSDTPTLADAYLTLLDSHDSFDAAKYPIIPHHPKKYYWIGWDLVTLAILPMIDLLVDPGTIATTIRGLGEFAQRAIFWTDGFFDLDDPLPWWWVYHVYWPLTFLSYSFSGTRWSRVNISTLKTFAM